MRRTTTSLLAVVFSLTVLAIREPTESTTTNLECIDCGEEKQVQSTALTQVAQDQGTCGCEVKTQPKELSFDGFISYRVKSDKDTAEKLAFRIEAHPWSQRNNISVWWDGKNIEDGEIWKDAFCHGISQSQHFIPLISEGGFQSIKSLQAGAEDNFLTEIETAIQKLDSNPHFIIPVCVGRYIAHENNHLLQKFDNFNVNDYPDVKSASCSTRTVRETMKRLFEIQCIPLDPEDMSCGINRIVARMKTTKLKEFVSVWAEAESINPTNAENAPQAVEIPANNPLPMKDLSFQFLRSGKAVVDEITKNNIQSQDIDKTALRAVANEMISALDSLKTESSPMMKVQVQPNQVADGQKEELKSDNPVKETSANDVSVNAQKEDTAIQPQNESTAQTDNQQDSTAGKRASFASIRPPRRHHSKVIL